MLTINLLTLMFLLLNIIRRSLLTFDPSKSTLEWYVMAISFHSHGQPRPSSTLSRYRCWLEQGLLFGTFVYLAIQSIQGLLPPFFIVFGVFGAILLLLACIDWFYFLLPDFLTYSLMVLGFASSTYFIGMEPINIMTRCVLCYGTLRIIQGVYYALRHQMGLGGGDIKLTTALACWFDTYQLCSLILVASIIALLSCLWQYRGLSSLRSVVIPFGTFLCLSGMYCAYLFHKVFLSDFLAGMQV